MPTYKYSLKTSARRLALMAGCALASIWTSSPVLADANQEDCGNASNSMSGTHIVACGIFNESGGNAASSAQALFGYNNIVMGNGAFESTALGVENRLGINGSPMVQGAVAVGVQNSAVAGFSSAIGYDNKAYGVGTTAVGFNNHVGSDTDPTVSLRSSAFGSGNMITGPANPNPAGFDASLAVGERNSVYGNQNIAIGNRSQIGDVGQFFSQSLAEGVQAKVFGNESTAIGYRAQVGTSLQAANQSMAIGNGAYAAGDQSVALGTGATTDVFARSVAVGSGAGVFGAGSVALGADAITDSANSVALGAGSYANAAHVGPYTVNGGSVAGTVASGVVSVGNAGGGGTPALNRQIQNVAAGVVSATSTDAVNGSQLYALGSQSANIQNQVAGVQNQVNALTVGYLGITQDVNALKTAVQRGYEGTAVALATAGGNFLQPHQKFSVTGKFGTFRGQTAFGAVAQARLSENMIAHAGVGGGLRYGGVGGFGGLTIGW
jgi:trimeric autotransporter adhesin